MNKLINKIDKDRRLSLGLALLFIIAAYIDFSLALNSGSLIQYFVGFVCLFFVIYFIKRAILKR